MLHNLNYFFLIRGGFWFKDEKYMVGEVWVMERSGCNFCDTSVDKIS